ncbi:MAG TPA: leukotriene A4 hydrolase C-terminal domain-containing protein [Actinomycetota bacterium]|nr:leukotriene A4 hydrolase C-terminal domain-containing protein [Actinomycetota bacterium]
MLERAAWEFADSEKMIEAVESLYGPYQWGRYDLLIMPPSFPFGGMEHARLSFITPTVITGDRGLVDLISHELAHSWSGNFVTNGTWRDLWLNEGVTTYVENRVIEALYGKERADMDLVVNHEDALAEIAGLDPEAQILAIDLRGEHPDAVFTDIPYAKGMLFFKFLEDRVGREAFDSFLRQYFEDFAWGTITTDAFETYLKEGLMAANPDAFNEAEITEWIHQPGYPTFGPVPEAAGYALADETLARLASGDLAPADVDTEGWMIQAQLRLIKGLPLDMDPVSLAEIDAALGLSTTGNIRLAYEWLLFAAKAGYTPALDARFERLMTEQGRIAFTKDLYGEVLAIDPERAKAVYAKARPGYHPITAWEVDQVFEKH